MTSLLAQNPDELFDVVTPDGVPTGHTKRRADVHRDGDWHRAVHVWVYGCDDNGPFLLMNQRGRHKDTWPLALDATVGGHLGAGESVEDAFREIEEEIGVFAKPASLHYLGRRARESHGAIPGIIDREIQDIYLLRDNRPLLDYRPNPAELEGLVQITLGSSLQLFTTACSCVAGIRLRAEDHVAEEIEIRTDALLVLPNDDYFGQVARAMLRIIRGEPNVTL